VELTLREFFELTWRTGVTTCGLEYDHGKIDNWLQEFANLKITTVAELKLRKQELMEVNVLSRLNSVCSTDMIEQTKTPAQKMKVPAEFKDCLFSAAVLLGEKQFKQQAELENSKTAGKPSVLVFFYKPASVKHKQRRTTKRYHTTLLLQLAVQDCAVLNNPHTNARSEPRAPLLEDMIAKALSPEKLTGE
jgi:hypothetical protein